jgi:soluble lytic murein transglycosylase-like protein
MTLQTNSLGVSRPLDRATPMTAQAKSRGRVTAQDDMIEERTWSQAVLRFLPAWIILALVMSILLPNALSATFGAAAEAATSGDSLITTIINPIINPAGSQPSSIAPLFTAEVDRWADDIARWAAQYGVDPNLLATVMQIESCGDSTVSSHAGAQGLFQVMPFHFSEGEVYTDPDTNAMRSANFLNQCLGWANGDTGLALGCYNGGPSIVNRPFANWPSETQRYYTWGTGIYADAQANLASSPTLDSWLGAGGVNLCNRASATQALQ